MYKVELIFDTNRLNKETIEQLCHQTDKIFKQEDLSCAERLHGKKIYVDKGRNDYGTNPRRHDRSKDCFPPGTTRNCPERNHSLSLWKPESGSDRRMERQSFFHAQWISERFALGKGKEA